MQEIYHALGHIEAQVQGLHTSMHYLHKTTGRLETRIAELEHRYYFWRGGAGILLALSTMMGSVAHKILGFFTQGEAS